MNTPIFFCHSEVGICLGYFQANLCTVEDVPNPNPNYKFTIKQLVKVWWDKYVDHSCSGCCNHWPLQHTAACNYWVENMELGSYLLVGLDMAEVKSNFSLPPRLATRSTTPLAERYLSHVWVTSHAFEADGSQTRGSKNSRKKGHSENYKLADFGFAYRGYLCLPLFTQSLFRWLQCCTEYANIAQAGINPKSSHHLEFLLVPPKDLASIIIIIKQRIHIFSR